ncbi:hypothetical protein PV328_011925 [Microctonus aethiopoides]|uniref:Uncharacterized protein n=1 Tax=Microctonus aethiopoides TaxID=144406 RepID=A0AA39FHI9_9HYME|nr:hypothetical protein PV328_011925 [Microctonus aethiopoides]
MAIEGKVVKKEVEKLWKEMGLDSQGGRKERIEDDLTWEERRAKWLIEKQAERKRREGAVVHVGYMKMWVNGRVWMWDEVERKWLGCGEGELVGFQEKEQEGSIEAWDMVVLMETWVEEKGWDRLRGKLPIGYVWECQWAKRVSNMGRAMGGMIVGGSEIWKGVVDSCGDLCEWGYGGEAGVFRTMVGEKRRGGEWTYSGARGNSVIDYVLGNDSTWEGVIKMEVEEKVDSDHQPLVVWASVDGSELWGGDLGLEGKGESGKAAGKIFALGAGGGKRDAGVYGEGRVTKGPTERESRKLKGHVKKGEGRRGWEGERRNFFEERGWRVEELVGEAGWYGAVKGVGIPGYLKKNWGESRWQRVAKYRLGGGMKGNKYWLKEEEKRCRVCGWGVESWEHVWDGCWEGGREKGWQEAVGVVLGDEGEGEDWLRLLEEWRRNVVVSEKDWNEGEEQPEREVHG